MTLEADRAALQSLTLRLYVQGAKLDQLIFDVLSPRLRRALHQGFVKALDVYNALQAGYSEDRVLQAIYNATPPPLKQPAKRRRPQGLRFRRKNV